MTPELSVAVARQRPSRVFHLPLSPVTFLDLVGPQLFVGETLMQGLERLVVTEAIHVHGGRHDAAAEYLGISSRTMLYKLDHIEDRLATIQANEQALELA